MSEAPFREDRLKRRIARLIQQRDHWKNEHAKLHGFLASFPFYDRERKKLADHRAEQERVKQLEQRCKEQATLIEHLAAASRDRTAQGPQSCPPSTVQDEQEGLRVKPGSGR